MAAAARAVTEFRRSCASRALRRWRAEARARCAACDANDAAQSRCARRRRGRRVGGGGLRRSMRGRRDGARRTKRSLRARRRLAAKRRGWSRLRSTIPYASWATAAATQHLRSSWRRWAWRAATRAVEERTAANGRAFVLAAAVAAWHAAAAAAAAASSRRDLASNAWATAAAGDAMARWLAFYVARRRASAALVRGELTVVVAAFVGWRAAAQRRAARALAAAGARARGAIVVVRSDLTFWRARAARDRRRAAAEAQLGLAATAYEPYEPYGGSPRPLVVTLAAGELPTTHSNAAGCRAHSASWRRRRSLPSAAVPPSRPRRRAVSPLAGPRSPVTGRGSRATRSRPRTRRRRSCRAGPEARSARWVAVARARAAQRLLARLLVAAAAAAAKRAMRRAVARLRLDATPRWLARRAFAARQQHRLRVFVGRWRARARRFPARCAGGARDGGVHPLPRASRPHRPPLQRPPRAAAALVRRAAAAPRLHARVCSVVAARRRRPPPAQHAARR